MKLRRQGARLLDREKKMSESIKRMRQGKRRRAAVRTAGRKNRLRAIPEPNVTVTFRHVEPSDALRLYAERKLAHSAKYLRRTCEVHLTLSVDKYRQYGEVIFRSGAVTVAAQEETKDLYSVIDLLADKVARQLKRHLEKSEAKRVRTASVGEVLVAAQGAEEE